MASVTREGELIERLKVLLAEQRPLLAARGVREVSLVGSRARGTAGPASDVDLLVDLAPDATFGLFDLVAFEEELKTKLGTRVDVVFKSRLRPYIAERMTRDKVRLL
jgi:uncharacterized protein